MYKQYFDKSDPVSCLCEVLIKDKKADGTPIIWNGKPSFFVINKHSKDQYVIVEKKQEIIFFENNESILESIQDIQFKNSTFLDLYELTVHEKSVQEVFYEPVKILDKKYIAFKYKNKDFKTDEFYREMVHPLYPPLYQDPASGETVYADEPVDYISFGVVPAQWTITSDNILFISPKDFNEKRLFTYDEAKDFDSSKEPFHFKNTNALDIEIDRDREKNKAILESFSISQLFHITHLENMKNIIKKGILSHNIAHGGSHIVEDISLKDVNKKRNFIEPYNNRSLHDYVPLYFTTKNPMLFLRKTMSEKLVILVISPEIMLDEVCLFTDGNAASKMTSIYKDFDKLNKLDWDCLENDYWNDYPDGKRKKCSEVLILERIKKKYISLVIVNNNSLKEMVENITNIPTVIKPSYFFG